MNHMTPFHHFMITTPDGQLEMWAHAQGPTPDMWN